MTLACLPPLPRDCADARDGHHCHKPAGHDRGHTCVCYLTWENR